MLTRSALLYLINARLMPLTVTAPSASRDTILRKENVSSQTLTTPSPLISDAPLGIGTTKSALLAQRPGSSMQIKSVCPSPINARLMP